MAMRRDQTLRNCRGCGGLARDFNANRIVQKGFGQTLDLRRHGRREKQGLPRERDQFTNPLNIGNEPHIKHTISLVDHENFNASQQ